MRTFITTTTLALSLTLFSPSPFASEPAAPEPPPSNAIGANVMGAAGFLRLNVGSFELVYEHVFGGQHGLRVAGDFIHVHQASDHQQSHQWTFGGSAAYRFYPDGPVGPFVGLLVGYRRGFGKFGHEGMADFTKLTNEQLRVMPQAGTRFWVPEVSLGIVVAMGVGYGPYSVRPDGRDDAVAHEAARRSQDILGATPVAFELELSFAYAF